MNIIPAPVNVENGLGEFQFDTNVVIQADAAAAVVAEWFADAATARLGGRPKVVTDNQHVAGKSVAIRLSDEIQWAEAYSLAVNPDAIRIVAKTPAGAFYAGQTLLQLMPMTGAATLAGVRIDDAPRFVWRGLMLDCCRHFWPVEFVKRFIDLLASYKFNTFHWHLTEDQGWRIEIKKYPKLTTVGGFRDDGHGGQYGGFYTQGTNQRCRVVRRGTVCQCGAGDRDARPFAGGAGGVSGARLHAGAVQSGNHLGRFRRRLQPGKGIDVRLFAGRANGSDVIISIQFHSRRRGTSARRRGGSSRPNVRRSSSGNV